MFLSVIDDVSFQMALQNGCHSSSEISDCETAYTSGSPSVNLFSWLTCKSAKCCRSSLYPFVLEAPAHEELLLLLLKTFGIVWSLPAQVRHGSRLLTESDDRFRTRPTTSFSASVSLALPTRKGPACWSSLQCPVDLHPAQEHPGLRVLDPSMPFVFDVPDYCSILSRSCRSLRRDSTTY